jgi:hypothetical protein
MPQREVLEHQGALGPDPADETGEDEGDHGGHHRSGRPKVNVDKVDGVSRRHRTAVRSRGRGTVRWRTTSWCRNAKVLEHEGAAGS